jgi:DNA-binding HxlR family transcriptional regulator
MAARKKTTPTRGSRSGRPIMVLLDLLGRRWTLRILWELRGGPLSFRALQSACERVSPTVMNDRLRELRQADLVVLRKGEGYALTRLAEELGDLLVPMDDWAKRWKGRR